MLVTLNASMSASSAEMSQVYFVGCLRRAGILIGRTVEVRSSSISNVLIFKIVICIYKLELPEMLIGTYHWRKNSFHKFDL